MGKEISMHQNKVFGVEVSKHGLERGRLDYHTLEKIVGNRIVNNTIFSATPYWDWVLLCGDDEEVEVCKYLIISEFGYNFLAEYGDEIVYYNHKLDLYLWGVTHYGTNWSYVLTSIKLVEEAD